MNTFEKAIFNLRWEIEESRQNAIKEKLPADLITFYQSTLTKACNNFKERYLKPNEIGCMQNFDFAGSPHYIYWYQLHTTDDGRKVWWFYIEPSYRLDYLESKKSSFKDKYIYSIIETIPLTGEIIFPTYEEYRKMF